MRKRNMYTRRRGIFREIFPNISKIVAQRHDLCSFPSKRNERRGVFSTTPSKKRNHIKYAVLRRGFAMACAAGAQTVDCSPSVGNAGGDDGDAAGDADGEATGEGASSVASDDADAEEGRENP